MREKHILIYSDDTGRMNVAAFDSKAAAEQYRHDELSECQRSIIISLEVQGCQEANLQIDIDQDD